jgi:hypothetical protein
MMDKEHFDWYEWFYNNADFGPAHDDVVLIMAEQYTAETGKEIPDDII